MLLFVVLGMYVPCHCHHSLFCLHVAYTMRMDQCLLEFSETYCFSIQRKEREYCACDCVSTYSCIDVTLRQYDHCRVLHFVRGLGEFIAVIATMYYLTTIVYDVKQMQREIEKKGERSAEAGICIRVSNGE